MVFNGRRVHDKTCLTVPKRGGATIRGVLQLERGATITGVLQLEGGATMWGE